MTIFTDEQLTAFLDGELPEAVMTHIADAIETDEQLAERLHALEVDFSPIQDAFDELLTETPADKFDTLKASLQSEVVKPNKVAANDKNWLNYAIAASLALSIGLGIGRYAFEAPPEKITWKGEVARYQKLYTQRTLDSMASDLESAVANVSKDLGIGLSTKQFSPEGLTFQWAQVLAYDKQPLGQFMYQDKQGTPIAICVLETGKQDQAVSRINIKGLNAASWDHDGYSYIVIGDTTHETLEKIANKFVATI